MTGKILLQYMNMKREAVEIRDKVKRLRREVGKLENSLDSMVRHKDLVKDKVYGGYGGTQGFVIEGFPTEEYDHKKSLLMSKKLLLNQRITAWEEFETKLSEAVSEVESYIRGIDDSYIRRIINLRVVENLTWEMVAARIGGGNSEETVKKHFWRFVNMSQKSRVMMLKSQ